MSAESPRHVRSGGPLTVPSQPPSDRSIIDAVSGFINDVTLSSSSTVEPKDVIQWARFETADINEPTPEGDSDSDVSPLLLILGYGAGVQVWLIPPSGEAQEVLSWRQGIVRVLRILPTPQHGDCFASKRPLIALCDSASPGPSFCSLSFISIRGGEQVKSIKFKNPVLDVLANKRSVVISFTERFAVFDAASLEDRLSVTTCYPCPCPLGGSLPINPITLGDRWLAYADKKLNQSKRSSGGCEGEGVSSYTATVLHAAKSLSKGLRGLGETVAHSLAGRSTSQSPSPPNTDIQQPGVVTILDIEGNEEEDGQEEEPCDPIVAHFVAHSEAIIALKFDPSGMLLVTADRRGHDFHVFRINPHPCGPSLASVHHLYILHRGDTTAKVQDIAISSDSRWAAVSSLRGTTHVFAISPYGGVCGVRTHTAPRVVNRLSRFHRSAGLPIHTAAKRAQPTVVDSMAQGAWYPNPRLPPYPTPVTVSPLAQLRPTANIPTHTITRTSSGRQRLSSLSEDSNAVPLLARARFGPPSPSVSATRNAGAAPVAALYLMAANGALLHLLLHPKALSSIPKEKISDESGIELEVSAVAQWPLQRPAVAADLLAPLPPSNPLLQPQTCRRYADICMSEEERWLSQVEIVTHAGPHRRLWMGPQFVFKTYNSTGSNSSLSEAETVEVDPSGVARSNPVNMPGVRPVVPILIDSGSASSLEHSPSDSFRRKSLLAESGRAPSVCDVQLREDLAEAMKEDHGAAIVATTDAGSTERAWTVDPLGCVVQPPPAAPPESPPDAELYASSNCDEATFRPVLRAPAPPAPCPEHAARPLPATTTIPAQSVAPRRAPPAPHPAHPLPTDVVIPAALSRPAPAPQGPPPLPKPARSDDIHPPAESRLRLSPTPKSTSDRVVDDFSVKDTESRIRGSSRSRDFGESARVSRSDDGRRRTEPEAPLAVDKINSVKPEVKKGENVKRVDSTVKIEKTEAVKSVVASVKKVNKIEPISKDRIEPVPKDKIESVAKDKIEPVPKEKIKPVPKDKYEPILKDKFEPVLKDKFDPIPKDSTFEVSSSKEIICENVLTELVAKKPVSKEIAVEKHVLKEPIVKEVISKESIKNELMAEPETELGQSSVPISIKGAVKKRNSESKTKEKAGKGLIIATDKALDQPSVSISLKSFVNKELPESKPKEEIEKKNLLKDLQDNKKAEELAWDMLLNEPEKPVTSIQLPIVDDKIVEEFKAKPKKNRKSKKLDDLQMKKEEDTFVEIHTIEDKQQHSGELVSISTPYEEIEPISYFAIAKKTRSSKSLTPERKDYFEVSDNWGLGIEPTAAPKCKKSDFVADIEFVPDKIYAKLRDKETDTLNVSDIEPVSTVTSRESKPKKAKSLSPYTDRKTEKKYENEIKDVYVIDTMKEDFPEIQITKGKTRKKSPQPEKGQEEKNVEISIIKSWSTVAASKVDKKEESRKEETVIFEKKHDDKVVKGVEVDEEVAESFAQMSLQEKLRKLCKIPDIMVAECDKPTELNFVDEHHSLPDLPPLEPIDFVLDDFKLEVMRDSLLEVSDTKVENPKYKNIDNMLFTTEDTTSQTVESAAFNLVDLEKMPLKKEQGFNVVENDKITTQEVKMDDVKTEFRVAVMENTDDDITPPVEVDKDDKKSTGASNVSWPSNKQSSKNKKSRKKKK